MNGRCLAVLCGALVVVSQGAENWYPVGTVYFQAKDYSGLPVADAPYCGERRNVRTITQADGTQKILEYAPQKICRDSAGRTRYEYPVYRDLTGPQVGPLSIEISDPVARAKYVVYEINKTVYRQELPATRAQHPPCPTPTPAARNLVGSVENLGTQTMAGVPVEGQRYTLRPGSWGINTSVTETVESWWSPELGVYVLDKTTDAVDGELVHELIHVTRGEPDPELFRLPADYAVVDEAGDFSILWGSESGARAVESPRH